MPNFTYTRDIPFATHNPSTDQPKMQVNNNSIDDIIEVDHYSFNDQNLLSGYHKIVDLVPQVAVPALPAGVGAMLLSSTNGNLVFANAQIPAGTFLTNSNAPPVAAIKGSTFLPGGMILQWGQGNAVGGIFNDTLTYGLSTVYAAFTTAATLNNNVITNIVIASPNLTIYANSDSGSPVNALVYWMVIGIL